MSVRSTTVPSRAQMYCCLSREPQPPPWRRLNETAACGWVAVYSLTGIDTMPKDTVSDASARAAMRASSSYPRKMGLTSCQNISHSSTAPFPFLLFRQQLVALTHHYGPRTLSTETRLQGDAGARRQGRQASIARALVRDPEARRETHAL